MLPEIEGVARRRKLLGMTQKDFARLTMTSQSFIAKLESGKINPSYEIMKRILSALDSLEKRKEEEINAKKLYHRRVYSISEHDTVHTAARIMKRHNISQLPVMKDNMIIGSITEKIVVGLILKGKKNIEKLKAAEVMDEPFPTIQESTPLSAVSSLLNYNPAILVTAKGKISGIITKADLIKVIK